MRIVDRSTSLEGVFRRPPFGDQYHNVQRGDELGLGLRLAAYDFAAHELTDAIDRLLADSELRARMAAMGERIRSRDGVRVGADVVERVGRAHLAGA